MTAKITRRRPISPRSQAALRREIHHLNNLIRFVAVALVIIAVIVFFHLDASDLVRLLTQ